MWAWILAFVGLMLLAGLMAERRRRSIRAWVWITAIAGPLGPLALYMVGTHRNGAPPT